jgi:adenylosuccinate synthase
VRGAQGTRRLTRYVSSPACTHGGGALLGLDLVHAMWTRSWVVKAYATRVGAGPFVTELHETGDRLRTGAGRDSSHHYGRPRCGWLMPSSALRRAVNGLTHAALTSWIS